MDMNAVNPQLYYYTNGILMDRYLHPLEHIEALRKMSLHEQDVFVTGYPKSGEYQKNIGYKNNVCQTYFY